MGSKDDDYFVQKYKAGKKEAFFAINSPDDTPWIESFLRVVRERGLRPIYYSGVGRVIIPPAGKSSTLDNEIIEDFYPAKTKVLYFGEPKKGTDYEDHWALGKFPHVSAEDTLLIFISKDFPVEVLRRNGFKGTPIVVANPSEFEQSLRKQIVV